jgi:hypothetical protein
MADVTQYPQNYVLTSTEQTKQLNIVLSIDGLPVSFSVSNTYTRIRYGDLGIYYGMPDVVYGALRVRDDVKSYLSFDSGMTLSQRLEPEQGRASISQFSFTLIDKDGYVSQVVSPGGGILNEILGRAVTVRMGYLNNSYPEDYFVVFRGIITNVQIIAGKVNLSIGDANQKRRSATFKVAKTTLVSTITDTQLAIPLNSIVNFYNLIVDEGAVAPNLWTVKPYIKIQDEVIPYGYGAISGTTITALARGGVYARSTSAIAHDLGTECSNAIEVNGHPLNLALRIMLSGWGGSPWKAGVKCTALGLVIDGSVTPAANVIVLPPAIDADIDYGLVIGDRVQITGSTAGNDGTYTITNFGNCEGFSNRLIYISSNLALENPATSVTLSFYSQFDVLPENAGLKLTPNDIDVKTHIKYRDTVFVGTEYFMVLYITSQQTGKSFIESEMYLPIGAYSLTRYGRLSMGYTKPPVAADKLVVLDANNVINPQNIALSRGLNNRKFYNEIQFQYDSTDAGEFQEVIRSVDTDSLNKIGILQLLPINSQGLKAAYGAGILANRICNRLLTRFKQAAYDVQLSTFWNPGTFIEAGDGVVLRDGGYLKLTNFADGSRNLGSQVLEVTDRSIDLKTGQVKLTLTQALGNVLNARYAVISPSSQIAAVGTTTSQIKIKPSYGNTVSESLKWTQLVGIDLLIHDYAFTHVETRTLKGLSSTLPDTLILSSPLSFLPGENYIVDVARYGSNTDSAYNALAKAVYAFTDPTLTVLAGISTTQFTVSLGDLANLPLGATLFIRSSDWSLRSPDVTVIQIISANTIVVSESLGFTPSSGQKIELIGFLDSGGAYRFL